MRNNGSINPAKLVVATGKANCHLTASNVLTADEVAYSRSDLHPGKRADFSATHAQKLFAEMLDVYRENPHSQNGSRIAALRDQISQIHQQRLNQQALERGGERGQFRTDMDSEHRRVDRHSGVDFYTQTLNPSQGRGDGTVPLSSGSGLAVDPEQDYHLDETVLNWREQVHDAIYQPQPVLTSVRIALDNFAVQLLHDIRARL